MNDNEQDCIRSAQTVVDAEVFVELHLARYEPESVFEKFRILGEGESIKSSSGEPDAESTLRHGLDGYSLETGETITAGGSAWWAAAHD